MTSEIASPSHPILIWLSTTETPLTFALHGSSIPQTSPSVRRKRLRSIGKPTPAQKKRTVEEASLKKREPLHEMSEENVAFNMAVNINPQFTPRSNNKSGDSSTDYATPSGSSSATIPIPNLKLGRSAHNDRHTLGLHGMQMDAEKLKNIYKPFKDVAQGILQGERGSTMRPGLAEHIIKWICRNKTRSEDTIMQQLLPMIISRSRTVLEKTACNDNMQVDTKPECEPPVYRLKYFDDDGAIVNINR